MRTAIVLLAAFLTAPALAQVAEPQIIALNEADAEQCKLGKCVLVAPGAFKVILERIERGDEYEAAARELARKIVAERQNRCA